MTLCGALLGGPGNGTTAWRPSFQQDGGGGGRLFGGSGKNGLFFLGKACCGFGTFPMKSFKHCLDLGTFPMMQVIICLLFWEFVFPCLERFVASMLSASVESLPQADPLCASLAMNQNLQFFVTG